MQNLLTTVVLCLVLGFAPAACSRREEPVVVVDDGSGRTEVASAESADQDGVPKAAVYAGAATFGIAAGILLITAAGSALLIGSNMSGP